MVEHKGEDKIRAEWEEQEIRKESLALEKQSRIFASSPTM